MRKYRYAMQWHSKSTTVGVDGRMRGSYLYFLCCAGDAKGLVYIKIGVTDHPTKRLQVLTTGCALRPLTFGVCNVRTKDLAFRLEAELHEGLRQWRQQGEWFKFNADDKATFAQIRDGLLTPHKSAAWPMQITVSGVMPVVLDARRKGLYFARLVKRRGAPFRDFEKDAVVRETV